MNIALLVILGIVTLLFFVYRLWPQGDKPKSNERDMFSLDFIDKSYFISKYLDDAHRSLDLAKHDLNKLVEKNIHPRPEIVKEEIDKIDILKNGIKDLYIPYNMISTAPPPNNTDKPKPKNSKNITYLDYDQFS